MVSSSEHCMVHLFERAERMCGHCGNVFCDDCLVQPFPKRPPLCKNCAIVAAGIRSTGAGRPARSRREIKALQRAQNRKAAAVEEPKPSHKLRPAPAIIQSVYRMEPDAVPPQLAKTLVPARTRRVWRTAG